MPVAEPAYDCVDCGRTHVASLWDVRQVSPVGLVMKTESLFGDAPADSGRRSGTVDASRIDRRCTEDLLMTTR
jgi:hypothetical protein